MSPNIPDAVGSAVSSEYSASYHFAHVAIVEHARVVQFVSQVLQDLAVLPDNQKTVDRR